MASLGNTSMTRLNSCERDIQTILLEAIKIYDFSVTFGHRSPETQFELFKKGRKEVRGVWQIDDKDKIVTYKDGYEKQSRHNSDPSKAVDIVPYPIDWHDINRFHQLNGVILAVQDRLLRDGKITKTLTWGGNWKSFIDYPHYQIK